MPKTDLQIISELQAQITEQREVIEAQAAKIDRLTLTAHAKEIALAKAKRFAAKIREI